MAVLVGLVGCATAGWGVQARVDAGPFSVPLPVGEGWRVRIDRDASSVVCRKLRPGLRAGETRILVRAKPLPRGAAGRDDAAAGEAVVEAEIAGLRGGAVAGEYGVEGLRRSLRRIAGRSVPAVDFRATLSDGAAHWTVLGRLLVLVPPGAAPSGGYYVVLVTETYRAGRDAPAHLRTLEAADGVLAGLRPVGRDRRP